MPFTKGSAYRKRSLAPRTSRTSTRTLCPAMSLATKKTLIYSWLSRTDPSRRLSW